MLRTLRQPLTCANVTAARALGFWLATSIVAGLLLTAGPAHAAAGDLDPTFSNDGRATADFGGGNGDFGNDPVRQPDGKIVVAGSTENAAEEADFAVARFKPSGGLDATFSGDGKTTTDFAQGNDFGEGVALQPDGKIVVVGHVEKSTGAQSFGVARFKPNGALDPTFSDDGKTTIDFAGGESSAFDVAVQSDGKIVIAGQRSGAGDSAFALARLKSNGALDGTFSGDGRTTTDFAGGFERASAVAVQPDGKIVVAGTDDAPGAEENDDFALARFKPNGALDGTFSDDGKTTTDVGGRDGGRGAVLQPDGRIVVAGFARGSAFALARYRSNGALDPTFSGDGRTTTNFVDGFDGAEGVALQPDGKIVAAGSARASAGGTQEDFAVGRYRSNGSLDPAFSGDGKTMTDFAGSRDQASGVVVQPDGKIVAGGFAHTASFDFALVRYLGG